MATCPLRIPNNTKQQSYSSSTRSALHPSRFPFVLLCTLWLTRSVSFINRYLALSVVRRSRPSFFARVVLHLHSVMVASLWGPAYKGLGGYFRKMGELIISPANYPFMIGAVSSFALIASIPVTDKDIKESSQQHSHTPTTPRCVRQCHTTELLSPHICSSTI